MPDLLIENWYGMVAPAGTPDTKIVAALNRIASEAMADPDVKEKLADQGLTVARRHAGTFPRLHRCRKQEVARIRSWLATGDQSDAGVRNERSDATRAASRRCSDQ